MAYVNTPQLPRHWTFDHLKLDWTNLRDGDRILIAEGCTHHRQDDDIGTVKIPRLLQKKTGRKLIFEHAAGIHYPANLADYALVVHCGGCMLNRREMLFRIAAARAACSDSM